MGRKLHLPDEDIDPVWADMTSEEKLWYEEFVKATRYYNWQSLKYLCEIAPSDRYEELYEELNYESHAVERARYTIPTERFPSYSEWDYSWSAPYRNPNRRDKIDGYYEFDKTDPEFYSAPGKKVRFK